MARYKKCPRCELNYIEIDREFCDVCLAEMRGGRLRFADFDDDEEEEEKKELCPVCGENYILAGEEMCEECKKNAQYEEDNTDIDPEKDEEWRNFLDDESEEDTAFAGDSMDFEDFSNEENPDDEFSEEEEPDDFDFEDELQDYGEEDEDSGEDDEESDEDDDF